MFAAVGTNRAAVYLFMYIYIYREREREREREKPRLLMPVDSMFSISFIAGQLNYIKDANAQRFGPCTRLSMKNT